MTDNVPVYCFTIPSVSDGTLLDCRIYHPTSLQDAQSTQQRTRKAALIAHPYAPLGGSMDDAVVASIVDQLLDLDFVVGTFNFRGAADSHGSTSWSGKAERDDYISAAGHLIFYINQLQTPQTVANDSSAESPAGFVQNISFEPITLILGGYSYGSMIVTQLPPIAEVLAIFRRPSKWISEILSRVRELTSETNSSFSHQRETRGSLPDAPPRRQHKRQSSSQHSIIYGGNDDPSPADRHIDPTHKGVEFQTRIKHAMHRTHKSSSSTISTTSSKHLEDPTDSIPALPHIVPHYLLVSPLLPPLSNFLSFSPMTLFSWRHHDHKPPTLLQNPTLVVYGTKDMFTSSSKLDTWCKKMGPLSIRNKGLSSFRWSKVDGAGHFWREKGVGEELRLSVTEWVGEVVGQAEKP